MLLGILDNLSRAESLLNNLAEADFDLENVSVICADVNQRDRIAKDLGPLKGTTPGKVSERLIQSGVPQKEAEWCQEAVQNNKVLVVMDISPELNQAAEEMFRDHSAQIVKG